jgi:hypothetical protein
MRLLFHPGMRHRSGVLGGFYNYLLSGHCSPYSFLFPGDKDWSHRKYAYFYFLELTRHSVLVHFVYEIGVLFGNNIITLSIHYYCLSFHVLSV